jgi:hypothetical protein
MHGSPNDWNEQPVNQKCANVMNSLNDKAGFHLNLLPININNTICIITSFFFLKLVKITSKNFINSILF